MTEICLLDKIPEHEPMPVPKSLAGMNGCLHTGNKSLLSDVLTKDVSTPEPLWNFLLGDLWSSTL